MEGKYYGSSASLGQCPEAKRTEGMYYGSSSTLGVCGGAGGVDVAGLKVQPALYKLVNEDIIPGTGVDAQHFWTKLAELVATLGPQNQALLDKRETLQKKIDEWCHAHKGKTFDVNAYAAFLKQIGYLVPEGAAFQAQTKNVDIEIANLAGPQLVVPVDNARYALNAANARWGSIFDAVYGTDVIPEEGALAKGKGFNAERGKKSMEWVDLLLDDVVGLSRGSFKDIKSFKLSKSFPKQLVLVMADGSEAGLKDASKFAGFRESNGVLSCVLLRNHGIHVEININPNSTTGKVHHAGVSDIVMEAALTTIQDLEDSVSAVDCEDKVGAYSNWLGLMKGTLVTTFDKGGKQMTRALEADRQYTSPEGYTITLHGRSLLLCRNVGMHMYTDAVTKDGKEIPEHFLDAMVTVLCAVHDLKGNNGKFKNSRKGSVYIVKPKMHGPEEVALVVKMFETVEKALGLPCCTVKIGIMDEERRTTVNLKECVRAAIDRACFINTGFMDRTGDEIHTSMYLGPVTRKAAIKAQKWYNAYEDWNVDVGIACGLPGVAQIGKGMWAMPDSMRAMVEQKIGHPKAAANCAWVPSPTAAILHSTHYHRVDVGAAQAALGGKARANVLDILTPPMLVGSVPPQEIRQELENNCQGILGYMVRWIDQGVGCSKVPDINDVGLMEDRATLRINSQHLANWIYHGIFTEQEMKDTFARMAAVVDKQNASDKKYRPMAQILEGSTAYKAALDIVYQGLNVMNGYTEPVLHPARREVKTGKR